MPPHHGGRAGAHSLVPSDQSVAGVHTYGVVVVTAASTDDAAAAPAALGQLTEEGFPRLRLLWADGKYHNHALYGWVAEKFPSTIKKALP